MPWKASVAIELTPAWHVSPFLSTCTGLNRHAHATRRSEAIYIRTIRYLRQSDVSHQATFRRLAISAYRRAHFSRVKFSNMNCLGRNARRETAAQKLSIAPDT